MPRASALRRALISLETKMTRLPSLVQAEGDGKDAVVGDVRSMQVPPALLLLDGDPDRAAVRGAHARAQAALAAQTVEGADHLAGVAAEFVVVLLELVQLLDHRHRQDHGVVVEAGDGVAVVEEDVGVEDEEFAGHDGPRSRRSGCGVQRSRQVVSWLRSSQPSSRTTTMFSRRMPPQSGR